MRFYTLCKLKSASISHVNGQSLVLADYAWCKNRILRFSVEMFPASLNMRSEYTLELVGLRYFSQMLKIFGYIFLLETHQVYGHGCNGCKGRTRNVLTSSSRFGTPSSDATVSLKQDHRSWRGFWDKNVGFATKCENLFTCIFQYFSMCLAAAEKVLWPIIRQ